jgi:cation:H+ antiporter
MILTAIVPITLGVALIWISADKLEKYSIHSAKKLGMSPFLIGSTVIAFGTSAPEMLTSFFAGLEDKGPMIIGNVIGSNVANLSLVFGLTLFIIALKGKAIKQESSIVKNILILLASTILMWAVIATNPFSIVSSLILLSSLLLVIFFWFKTNSGMDIELEEGSKKFITLKLIIALLVLIFAAWIITFGATNILNEFSLGELFVGYTVLAIGTSLPEIAAASSLALKGRYETVAGTLIGSNIFNSLCVLAIPGLFNSPEMSSGWFYGTWSTLLLILASITLCFAWYIYSATKQPSKASLLLGLIFIGSYFLSLPFAY